MKRACQQDPLPADRRRPRPLQERLLLEAARGEEMALAARIAAELAAPRAAPGPAA